MGPEAERRASHVPTGSHSSSQFFAAEGSGSGGSRGDQANGSNAISFLGVQSHVPGWSRLLTTPEGRGKPTTRVLHPNSQARQEKAACGVEGASRGKDDNLV